jgi:hypothetical protein
MRRALIVLVVLVLVALAVLWQAPATLVTNVIQDRSGGRIKLADVSGTVWSGQGVLVAGDARLPIGWRVHPTPLAQGEATVDLVPVVPGSDVRGTVTVSEDRIRARDLRLAIPATMLADAMTQRPRIAAGGTIDIASDAVEWGRAGASGSVTAQWHDASAGLPGGPAIALGEITANLDAQQQRFVGPVRNAGGDVDLSGDVAVAERVERRVLDVAVPVAEARAARVEAAPLRRTSHPHPSLSLKGRGPR